ncbi:MAG: glycoside hydrolase family 43 protein [Acetobacter sp.]|nr:glycoside hydrolase family 43 protein [Bacteroides sp.]MCM1341807.1 glycoside hydrolase family 43 protein [Acetobacter sp.]MCM1433973.1 glycoside hydrolase family 43 protein [Clostridiales bacterium]
MKLNEINIRDPFVLFDNGTYFLYGTKAKDFGKNVGGFDVYASKDLDEWSVPAVCFDSLKAGLNREVNWAPEVHKYNGSFYMFATFTKENGLRGTYALRSDSPYGPFILHSDGALTPDEWECLDGTLYIDKQGTPYLVFCHEHTQIIDGTICCIKLSDDLTHSVGEAKYIFSGSSPYFIEKKPEGEHYITDGPFMYRTKNDDLLMIWSTFINHQYSQCIAKSDNGDITGNFEHLPPLITDDGGHGMIFKADNKLFLTFHTPNKTLYERPNFIEIEDIGNTIKLK